jgi:hypothetical protein
MSGYTPGPWHVCPENQADHQWVIAQADGSSVADCSPVGPWVSDVTADANARLIAAAPDVLEALMVAREWMRGDKWRNSTVEKHASWEAVMRGIDAAIAKATGEQP